MRRRANPWPEPAALLILLPVLLGAAGAPERAVAPDPAAERELVERINDVRARNGLPRLELSPRLAEAARAQALEMARQRSVSHRFPQEEGLRQRVAVTSLRFDFVGENVGRNRDAEKAHREFLSSPGHRENILDPRANAVGIGAVRTEEDGDNLWVAEDFAHVVPDYEPLQVEQVVAAHIAELRQQAGQPPLQRAELGPVRQEACAMSLTDQVSAGHQAAPHLRGTLHTIAYSSADPERIPEQLRDEVQRERPGSFSVGACFSRTPGYPAGAYWVVVVFYFPVK